MRNRDWFSKPHQSSGRSAHDYGNTRLDRSDERGAIYPEHIIIAVLFGLTFALAAWRLFA